MQNDIRIGDVVFLRTYEDMAANYPAVPNGTVIYYGPCTEKGPKINTNDSIIPYLGKFYTVQDINKDFFFFSALQIERRAFLFRKRRAHSII